MSDSQQQDSIKAYRPGALPGQDLFIDLEWLGQQAESLCIGSLGTLIGHFRTYSAVKLDRIRQMAQVGNHREYWKAVHDLRSSASNVGALGLQNYCLQVERLPVDQAMAQDVIAIIERQLNDPRQSRGLIR